MNTYEIYIHFMHLFKVKSWYCETHKPKVIADGVYESLAV
jgi:hypothetical protein